MTDLSGSTIKGYELIARLGEGAYGMVYRATQPQVKREVAVKIILPQYANQADFIRRFETEAQLVAQLEHPYIVPLYDYWREPDGAYLVMRLMKGGSLEDSLQKNGPWAPADAARLVDQVAAALEAAHQQGVVHRDLKPANILLDEAGNAYLSDFGIAKEMGAEAGVTQTGAILGTPAYITPEQVQSQPVTPQTDIYALGVVLYELLSGQHPFPDTPTGDMVVKHLSEPLPLVRERRPELRAEVDEVIQRATAKGPEARFPDALTLAVELRRALQLEVPLSEVLEGEIYNPYKGLRAFQEADADDFFGREVLTGQLLARLADVTDAGRFLAVVGPSGSGKSSAVKAGLLPALRKGALPGSDKWFVVEMMPGAHPLEELDINLSRISANPNVNVAEQLGRDERGLLRAARMVLPASEGELLLVVDQFEETFTLVEDIAEAKHFMDLIYAAVTDPHSQVRVIITLRADFYDRPLMYPDFSRLVQERTEVVIPLTAEELERAVRAPAERMGAVLESGLVPTIISDVVDQPGELPLLQYALTELFEHREGRLLTREAYQSIGGVLGALGRRADEVYDGLEQRAKDAARQLFLRLVTLGEGIEDTRRRVLRIELEGLLRDRGEGVGDSDQYSIIRNQYSVMGEVIDAFGEARLLSFDRDLVTRGPTVEVAHEALLREWRRLRQWLDESRADIRTQRVLGNAAAEWFEADQDVSFLLRGSRLDQFDAWVKGTDLALTMDEQAYLDASLEERRAREVTEAERQASKAAMERRSRNFLRALVGVLAVAAIVAVILSAFAFSQRGEAQNNAATAQAEALARATQQVIAEAEADARATQQAIAEEEANARATQQAIAEAEANARATQQALAEGQARLASSRELALAAVNNLTVDPERSILLALQALSVTHTVEAENALHDAVVASRVRFVFPGVSVTFSPDGDRLATGREDGSVIVWDTATWQETLTLSGHTSAITDLAFSPDGLRLAAGSEDGQVSVWDLEASAAGSTNNQALTLSGHTDYLNSIVFSSDGSRLATASVDDRAIIWDALTGELLQTLEVSSGGFSFSNGAAFSPDGRYLLTGDWDGVLKVWDAGTGEMLFMESGFVTPFSLSPDGTRLASADFGPDAFMWDVSALFSPQFLFTLSGHKLNVIDLDFNADGTRLATGSLDSTAKLWDVSGEKGVELFTLAGHTQSVGKVSFSPNGTYLATASADGTVRVWDVSPAGSRELLTLSEHADWLRTVDYSPDGTRLATSSYDGTAKVWDVDSGEVLFTLSNHSGPVKDVAFSPDGTLLATVGEDKTARIWDANTGQETLTLTGHGEGIIGGFHPGIAEVNFSPDGKLLATAGADGTAKLWDVATGEELLSLQGHPDGYGVTNVVFSPDGSLLATTSDTPDAVVKVWDLAAGEETFTRNLPNRGWGLAFSPDGTQLVTAGSGGFIIVWEVATGQEAFSLSGHTSTVASVAFSPDGTLLGTSGSDGIKIWEFSSGQELLNLPGHTGAVNGLAFSPDGTRLATASRDGTSRLYLLEIDGLVSLARSRVTRALTKEECQQYLHVEECPN